MLQITDTQFQCRALTQSSWKIVRVNQGKLAEALRKFKDHPAMVGFSLSRLFRATQLEVKRGKSSPPQLKQLGLRLLSIFSFFTILRYGTETNVKEDSSYC